MDGDMNTENVVLYELTNTQLEIEDCGLCELYGVTGRDTTGRVVACISGISSSAEDTRRLVELLNDHKVSYVHAKDVVEDFVAMM